MRSNAENYARISWIKISKVHWASLKTINFKVLFNFKSNYCYFSSITIKMAQRALEGD